MALSVLLQYYTHNRGCPECVYARVAAQILNSYTYLALVTVAVGHAFDALARDPGGSGIGGRHRELHAASRLARG